VSELEQGTILGAGGKLERGRVETQSSRERAEPVATVARAHERDPRSLLQRRVDRPCGARELDRCTVVVRDMLGMVFSTAETLDPLRGAYVLLPAVHARDLTIGHVAHEHMPECELILAAHRRATLAANLSSSSRSKGLCASSSAMRRVYSSATAS